jgi:hypothetical protein
MGVGGMSAAVIDHDEARRLAADRARIRGADPARYDHLAEALTAAVPAEIEKIRDLADEQRAGRGDWLRVLNLVGAKGDVLLYGGGQPGETAAVFARLAETLAVLAYADGGVTVFGLHWCAVPHRWCPGASS